jgi:uncharacterized membrane protein YoaK (UPF0700 family)
VKTPEAHEPSSRVLVALGLLTFVTGVVDAASVLGLGHVFTANMTGNVVFLGFALAGAGRVSIASSAVALAAFLAGAVLGGRLARHGASLPQALGAVALLLALAAGVEWAYAGRTAPSDLLIVLLAAAMGIQNATVRHLAVRDMTTTVLTLTLTGLAADSRLAGGDGRGFGRRVFSVIAMLVGALSGAWVLSHGLRWALLLSAGSASIACLVSEDARVAAAPPRRL